MKQLMISMLLCLATLTAAAQGPKEGNMSEKLFDAKVRELVYRLNITDEQKPKFVPIYRRYSDEMAAAWGQRSGKEKTTKVEGKVKKTDEKAKRPEGRTKRPVTSQEAADAQKRKMERQQRAQSIRIKYIDELATVLTAEQVNRFFEVEGKIQKKLMERKKTRKGPHRKGGGKPSQRGHRS